ncbi:hypothetical protein [Paraclostridium bifermentans]|uniref:hypothetical protein n=1 Tax=Paraclostridium bifermentans TaxID=1490 RepID=UPI0022E4F856|nr:hypothetical protein [Paraclostridium bifermentans]
MEYFWYTILKRTDDFWSIYPKYFFKMQKAHMKFNNVNEESKKKVSTVDTTSYE